MGGAEQVQVAVYRGPQVVFCGVPLLSQARDLGIIRSLPDDGVLKMNAFKLRAAVPERVQVDDAGRSEWEMECQVTGLTEYWHPAGAGKR
jgi:hypothetical protein